MTAPYTFVGFRRPLPGSAFGDRAGAVFDRPVPGRYSGRIELTITTLSPLFIGSADVDSGTAVKIDGCFAIPGSALKGMLRAYLAAMTGSSLGPPHETIIWYRTPVGTGNATVEALKNWYQQERGAAAKPGAQRIGLLVRDPVHGYAVLECPQLRLPLPKKDNRFYSAVPKVTWRILGRDLPVRRDITDPELVNRNDRRVWVVWAAVETTSEKSKSRSVRQVVFAVGSTADDARSHAESRKKRGAAHESVPRTCTGTEFVSFLGVDGLYERNPQSGDPLPVQMILHATGLTAPNDPSTTSTHTQTDSDDTRNAYVFPIPDTGTAAWISVTGDEHHRRCTRIPVADSTVVAALTDPDQQQLTDYQKALPAMVVLLDGDGVPVFFDTATDAPGGEPTVVRLGRGNGFRIKARNTAWGTVPEEYRSAGFDVHAPDLVQSLFGDSNDEHAMKGRVSCGNALAPPDARALARQDRIALLSPKIQAWYRRIQQPSHPVTSEPHTYDHPDATYRGREMYLHRWRRVDEAGHPETSDQAWARIADKHRLAPTISDKVGRSITPVASRTRFTGSIRFTNLTAAELGALIVVLTLGNDLESNHHVNENPHFAHLLGGGRPLGLGSVHLAPTVYLDRPDRYRAWGTQWSDLWQRLGHNQVEQFVGEFTAALQLAEPDQTQWQTGPDGRRRLRSIAEVFTIAQWRHRLMPAQTAEMSRNDHQRRLIPKPLSELFTPPP